jgi:hypothetical protein
VFMLILLELTQGKIASASHADVDPAQAVRADQRRNWACLSAASELEDPVRQVLHLFATCAMFGAPHRRCIGEKDHVEAGPVCS